MTKILLFMGTLLTTMSFLPYIRDIIRHGARPRLVSWLVWSILMGLLTVVALQDGQLGSAVVSGVSTVGCLIVVALGWRYAARGVTRLEQTTLIAAAVGLIAWFTVDSPLLVMGIALAIDALAYIPTFIHGWQQPEEESLTAYGVGVLGGAIVIFSSWLMHAGILGYVYPVYAVTFGLVMVGCISISRWYGAAGGFAAETY